MLYLGDIYKTNFKTFNLSQSSTHLISKYSAQEHLTALRNEAFSAGLQLSPQVRQELIKAAETCPLIDSQGCLTFVLSDIQKQPEICRDVAIAQVLNSSDLPAVQKIAIDPLLLKVVSRYLGYQPREVSSWLFWSFANPMSQEEREAQFQTVRFHFDVHGLNFMYVNFYLSDTNAESGAHVLIRGSHRQKKLSLLLQEARISDEQALAVYGKERVQIIEGSAGEGFFEDTSCYHKALPPQKQDRLMLQLRYL